MLCNKVKPSNKIKILDYIIFLYLTYYIRFHFLLKYIIMNIWVYILSVPFSPYLWSYDSISTSPGLKQIKHIKTWRKNLIICLPLGFCECKKCEMKNEACLVWNLSTFWIVKLKWGLPRLKSVHVLNCEIRIRPASSSFFSRKK